MHGKVHSATRLAIEKALDVALSTIKLNEQKGQSSDRWHKLAAGASGAAGGLFGLPTLALGLSISTTIMLRSIADIARSEGEDLHQYDARLRAQTWTGRNPAPVQTAVVACCPLKTHLQQRQDWNPRTGGIEKESDG